MSLLTSASVWRSTQNQKRIPSIRKTIKKTSLKSDEENTPPPSEINDNINENYSNYNQYTQYSNYSSVNENTLNKGFSSDTETSSIKEKLINEKYNNRNEKVNILLDQMSKINDNNDGSHLYDYTSPSSVEKFTQQDENNTHSSSYPSLGHPLFEKRQTEYVNETKINNFTAKPINVSSFDINANTNDLANLSNYNQAYETPSDTKVYYTKSYGLGNGQIEEKILDKIQYLTHLLEEMQTQKTYNVTEEYILYIMMGVFIIYIVDSFTRLGRVI
jgi:hypothetical protein